MRQYISLKVPLIRPSGEVYAVCGISTDITDRKRKEEQLVEMYRQLQGLVADRTSDLSELNRLLREQSDARADLVLQLSGLIAAANEGIWTIDVEGVTTFVNPRMAAMLGYAVDELLGKPLLEFVTATHRERAQQYLVPSHPEPQAQADFEFRRKDGSTSWALTSTNPIRNARGELVGTLCMLTDITDRKRAEEHQTQLLQELDHRVKNCLATVVGLADVSMEKAASLEEFRDSFSARMQAMTRTHESLAKAHWQNVELGDVVEVVLAPQRAASRGTIRAAGEPVALAPSVATPLALVLNELGTNALKHGALSSGSGQVCVTWKRQQHDRCELTWLEEGGPEIRSPTHEGIGLGLIRGLVEYELGGAVAVEFLPAGLRCRIQIPPSG
jgi:two-component system CheB/CheR fusion protein